MRALRGSIGTERQQPRLDLDQRPEQVVETLPTRGQLAPYVGPHAGQRFRASCDSTANHGLAGCRRDNAQTVGSEVQRHTLHEEASA